MNISKTIKKTILFLLLWLIIAGCTGKKDDAPARYLQYADISAEQIVSTLTLKQKAMQMVQPACYNTSLKEMKKNCFGSILSRNFYYDFKQWQDYVDGFQKMAVDSEGQGIADVICGGTDFKGRLPSPWYSSISQIGSGSAWLEKGFGLTYENAEEN